MWTRLGKVLVYVAVVLSVLMCAMGVGVYTNRLDWAGKGTPPGIVFAHEATARDSTKLVESAAPAVYDAYQGQAGLLLAETTRPAHQHWYIDQLAILEGQDAHGQVLNAPVPEVAYGPTGQLTFDQNGHPAMKQTALASRVRAVEELKKVRDRIADVLAAITKRQKEFTALTLLINGDKENHRKGLKEEIQEVRAAQQKADTHVETLRPLTINRHVEALILEQRKDALDARIRELETRNGTGVARRLP
ncbi:MAG TPA: hypothetical protein VFA18_02325, partial [Gemmataceae bacterium]|nr:hypothetical protein [Gemmataceae bacterium]